jgi:hypothetical protein
MTQAPPPLVPPDVDLAGYGFMPLHGHRLFGSDFNALCSDAEWRAGVTLWWAAWNQVPAASLPDDDTALCRLADLGRDVRSWRKLRANALHGFVLCSDGRLYHQVLARLAIEAWDRRVRDRDRKAKWRAGKNVDGDGDKGRDGDGDGDGDVPAEAKRSDVKRSEANLEGGSRTPPPTPGVSDARARGPAAGGGAGMRLDGVDRPAVAAAVARGDLLGLLVAFGCDTTGGRMVEWFRDTDGTQLGKVAIVLAWRRHALEPVRQPSGWRAAAKAWSDLPGDDRTELIDDLVALYGLPSPVRPPVAAAIGQESA